MFPAVIFAFPMTDARNLALGGMALASAPQESAMFLDPALLGGSEKLRTTFSQIRLSPSDFDFELSGALPLVKDGIVVGLGWDGRITLNQEQTGIVRDSNGQVVVDPSTGLPLTQILGFFTQSNNVFYLSAGAKFGFYSMGASLKYFLQDFGSTEGNGFGLDLSSCFRFSDHLTLGTTLFDFGNTTVRYNQNQPALTYQSILMTSLACDFLKIADFSFLLEPGFSKGIWNQQPFQWAAGIEACWHKDVFARVGANQERLSFGVGLAVHPQKIFSEIKVDYTYLAESPDGYPSRLTLSVGW